MAGSADTTSSASARRRGQLAIAGSAIAWSTAGALQRELSVDTATQMAGRAGVAAVALSLLAVWQAPGRLVDSARSIGRIGIGLAACMAGASAMFIVALNRTTVANVLLVQALAPFIAVLLAWMLLRETPSRRTWLATIVALVGVGIMVGGPGSGPVSGLIAAMIMTVLFAVTIVIARHRRDISMAPAVALSQIMLFAGALPFANVSSITRRDALVMVVMGVFQTGLGQALFVIGARLISAAEVALITMLEVVLGPFWVWLAYSEQPGAATLLGGVIVLVAVVVQTTDSSTSQDAPDSAGAGLAATHDAVDLAKRIGDVPGAGKPVRGQ
jgi:drug/metabolite transporter (DMT)-like permease